MSTIFGSTGSLRITEHFYAGYLQKEMFVVQNCILFGTTNHINRKSTACVTSVPQEDLLPRSDRGQIWSESKNIDDAEAGALASIYARPQGRLKTLALRRLLCRLGDRMISNVN